MSEFCTAVSCIDGRTALPVINYLQKHFGVPYVDMVTEAGVNGLLATQKLPEAVAALQRQIQISIDAHDSVGIAVVGHHDCAGNPTPQAEQAEHTRTAVRQLRQQFPDRTVVGLWVNQDWAVEPVDVP